MHAQDVLATLQRCVRLTLQYTATDPAILLRQLAVWSTFGPYYRLDQLYLCDVLNCIMQSLCYTKPNELRTVQGTGEGLSDETLLARRKAGEALTKLAAAIPDMLLVRAARFAIRVLARSAALAAPDCGAACTAVL